MCFPSLVRPSTLSFLHLGAVRVMHATAGVLAPKYEAYAARNSAIPYRGDIGFGRQEKFRYGRYSLLDMLLHENVLEVVKSLSLSLSRSLSLAIHISACLCVYIYVHYIHDIYIYTHSSLQARALTNQTAASTNCLHLQCAWEDILKQKNSNYDKLEMPIIPPVFKTYVHRYSGPAILIKVSWQLT